VINVVGDGTKLLLNKHRPAESGALRLEIVIVSLDLCRVL
jgi:hypothetical protein